MLLLKQTVDHRDHAWHEYVEVDPESRIGAWFIGQSRARSLTVHTEIGDQIVWSRVRCRRCKSTTSDVTFKGGGCNECEED